MTTHASPGAERPRLAVLLSGQGSNLRVLAQAIGDGRLRGQIVLVASDREDAPGLRWAREQGLPVHVEARARHPDRAAFEQSLFAAVTAAAPHWVVLAGFMRVLSAATVRSWRGRMINLHPSLLPRHPGLDTHRRALQAGDSEHGASVHFVTEVLDGGPVIAQIAMPIEADDDPERLAARLRPLEHVLLLQVVSALVEGRLQLDPAGERVLLDGVSLTQPWRLALPLPGTLAPA